MKHTGSAEIDYYRVQQRWIRTVPEDEYVPGKSKLVKKHWWCRTWQAEWDGCEWAPRAYTKRGIERRARRVHRGGGRPDWQIAVHRWVRRNVTRRETALLPEPTE